MRDFIKRLMTLPPIGIIVSFVVQILLTDYAVYAKAKKLYGRDCVVLGTAMRGTGDYYLCGLYLHSWLKEQNITDFCFLVGGKAEREVADLFGTLSKNMLSINASLSVPSDRMCAFLQNDQADMHWFHAPSRTFNLCSMRTGNILLQGYKGINMLDWYFDFFPLGDKETPSLTHCELPRANNYVVIAPYSNGNTKGQISDEFWKSLIEKLRQHGFIVFTNCGKEEKPLPQTKPLKLPYSEMISFLDTATAFIGVRSGLCEIVSSAKCKKIIIHLRKSHWWPDGHSLAYTSLMTMKLCNDVLEFEYIGMVDESKIINHILASPKGGVINK